MSDQGQDETRKIAPRSVLDEAALALTKVFESAGINHAFCGGYLAMAYGIPNRGSEVSSSTKPLMKRTTLSWFVRTLIA